MNTGQISVFMRKFRKVSWTLLYSDRWEFYWELTTCHTLKQVKQNATNNLALFSGQLFMLLQMVCSVLLTVLHFKTLLLIVCEITTDNQNATNKWFLIKTQQSKTGHTIWKNKKNWAENWCQIICGILFDLIHSMTSSETPLPLGKK